MKVRNALKKYGPKIAVASVGAMSLAARAEDPATALAALSTLTTGQAGYGPVLFGLAIATVGVMIGIKWIKRGRSAA